LNNEIIKKFQLGFAPKDKDLIYRMASNTNEMFGQNRSKDLI
jgi:hypothetical protein